MKQTPLNAPEARMLHRSCGHRLPHPIPEAALFAQPHRLLYANLPRTGLEPKVTAWIVDNYRPARIAYMSCSAETLHRDLCQLTA